MSLDISSFTGRLNSPVRAAGQTLKPGKENTQSGLKANPEIKYLGANAGKPDSVKTEDLDRVSFSTGHRVDYKIDQETQEVIIRVVDIESGEVIKQIPGEDIVKLVQRIAEYNKNFLDQTT